MHIIKKMYVFSYVHYEYARVRSCTMCVQEPVSESWELELQAVKKSPVWMLGLTPLDGKAASALNPQPCFQFPNKS